MENGSIPGYKFLCEVLGSIYTAPQMKEELLIHAQTELPLDKEISKIIQNDFAGFAYDLKNQRNALFKRLDAFLGSYYKDISTFSFFSDAESLSISGGTQRNSLESMFKSLLRDQVGTSNISLAGIAMTVTLSVGYSHNSCFYVGRNEARFILSQSMEILGYNNTEVIPDKCFEVSEKSPNDDLVQLLLLALLGALKVKYPHKKSAVQSARNKEKARETIDHLVNTSQNSDLFISLRGSREITKICQGMTAALIDDSENVTFPNGRKFSLASFYRIPRFETIGNATTEILRCDYNFFVRSLVIGKTGSGKTLLTKAIVRTCVDGPEARNGIYIEYAKTLGLGNTTYYPLVYHCSEFTNSEEIEQVDLIEQAVYQLVKLTRTTSHASSLLHWDEFATQVLEYYKRKARDSTLLLIIEDISRLNRKASEALLKQLRDMECTEYNRLHILVVTQRLVPSQMRHFLHYNRVEIGTHNCTLEEDVKHLVELGASSSATAEDYLAMLNNRIIRSFLDCPKHLVNLLCFPFSEVFDFDTLLRQMIEESIEMHYSEKVTERDCRFFLTALAVFIAESKKGVRLSAQSHFVNYRSIPKNIIENKRLIALCSEIVDPNTVWQHIMDNMILVCPNSDINSYAFINPVFYCSLVADYYLQCIRDGYGINWLEHFNSLSAEDYSCIIVMVYNRLYRMHSSERNSFLEMPNPDVLLLVQSTIGYVATRTEPTDLFYCLLSIQDILSNNNIVNMLQPNLINNIKQVYSTAYCAFLKLSDDQYRNTSLKKPEEFNT